MYIVISVLAFAVLIAIHELGHFTAAKCSGVRVEEYSIGMGPAIWKRRRGDTLYALRILPLGGYCAMAGEDGESDDPMAFGNQSFLKKLIILVAGSAMNFLLALILIMIMYRGAGAFVTTTVDHFMDGCPYEGETAMLPGDSIYSIDGHRVYLVSDIQSFLIQGDGVYDLVLLRDGEKIELPGFELVTKEYDGQQKYGFVFGTTEATLGAKLRYTWYTAMEFSRWVWMGLRQLVSGAVKLNDMYGAVGMVDLMNTASQQAASTGAAIENLLYIVSIIAVNLAAMNMLPIPGLDGGRIFMMTATLIIEKLTRRRLDPKYEGYINFAGMLLLLLLMAVVMYNDISRIIMR